MKTRSIYILFLMCVTSVMMVAQENKNTLPDLQVANTEFFDPTRKDKSKENYVFSTTWRLEAGYAQLDQRQDTSSLFMHGLRIGATVDFVLPHNFSIQTGALATFTYGQNNQHYPLISAENAQINILQHNILQLQLTVPVRAYYNIKLWKQLRLLFFAGPQLQFGLTNYDIINNKTDIRTEVRIFRRHRFGLPGVHRNSPQPVCRGRYSCQLSLRCRRHRHLF